MSIGDELWALARALCSFHMKGEEVSLPNWHRRDYFSLPDDFFSDGPFELDIPELEPAVWDEISESVKHYLQPSKKALEVLMGYEDFWLLEPPVLGVHISSGVSDDFYAEARDMFRYESVVVFGDHPDEEDLESDAFFFRGGKDWVVPHLMSFCDYHIISDSADSWWGAFLSDDREAVYPLPNPNRIFPRTWRPYENIYSRTTL